MNLSASATPNTPFVEDLVNTLTGPVQGELNAAETLREQMKRAAAEFDERSAQAAARALLDELSQDSSDVRRLEALLIMGLAHPSVLEKHRIPLAQEGRRLAQLLERASQGDRARCILELLASKIPNDSAIDHDLAGVMRRTGSTDALVERYLRRADDAAQHGKTMEAVTWLQEVVLLDRNRRDVARMIRDLRYQEKERRVRTSRQLKLVAFVLVIAGLVGVVVMRESGIHADYAGLPTGVAGDLNSMRQRLDGLEELLDKNVVWAGMSSALIERGHLRTDVEKLENEFAQKQRVLDQERKQQLEVAESMRMRGVQHAQQGKFDLALSDFRSALEFAAPNWEHRQRVEADVTAIEAWQKGSK
jgi:tetratricopeptide (TPR) repeat protein